MNPMQGPRNTGTEVNQGDNEPVYSTETSLNNMMNPVDNEFSNTSTPSGRPSYASSSSHGAQNPNWWRFGESSSLSGPSDQVGMETNHQLPQDASHQFEGRQLGLNGMMVHGGAHTAGYIRDGPTFLRGSSSNAIPQHVNMSIDMDSDDYGAQTSGVVFRHSSYGSSLGSSVQAAGESSSGPASSLGLWGSSCKRKTLEGVPSTSFSGETQTENAGLSHYGASSSLSLATPSQSSPNVTNHFGRTEPMFGAGGGRAVVATNAFHSVRNSDTSSRPGRRLNPRQPPESVAFSISLGGSSVRPTGSLQQNILLNTPSSVDPLDARSTSFTSGSSSGENQTNTVHHPALTRNIHQFAWDASFSSRGSSSPGIEMPQWETPRSNPEQPMFAPTTDIRNPVHDQSMWTFTRGSPGSSIDSPFVSRERPSLAIHGQQPNPAWIPPQSAPIHNPTRASELSPWSLFPSIESQTASHGASLPLLPTGPSLSSNEAAMPSSSNSRSHRSRQRRSGLLSERQNELLHLRHLGRSLAADSDGRNHLISEIRQVLTAMRRGESLRIEDYMVLDPLIFQGMTEMHDRHREMRLDVDNMSYEELLALGERIGDVSTGLSEDVILKTMKQHKCTSSSPELHQYMEPCCICQEEYAEGDDLGTLECGHEFHKDCIKQWVMLKNLCPICKTVALTT
ncbi:hypothetical protein N665_0010s0042 [Sinapis alba]|nr:hypothetical protein N665_0010s0042 [Sinapis alba]KAF8117466.1 hypothetical protein N665_0010s0042 [Sinapis alba]